MKPFILFAALAAVILILTGIIVQRDNKIKELRTEVVDLNRQIRDLRSINRVQEDWLRSCGFYGKEE